VFGRRELIIIEPPVVWAPGQQDVEKKTCAVPLALQTETRETE